MALVDLVKIVVNTTGTGALTLGAAVIGYRGKEALIDGETYDYSIQQEAQWEVGRCTFLSISSQIIRTPMYSSNGGSAVNLQAGAAIAFTILAETLGDNLAVVAAAVAATASDRIATGQNRAATDSDVAATTADREQTGLARAAAVAAAQLSADWAEKPTAPAGGGTKSAKSWAGEAAASVSAIGSVSALTQPTYLTDLSSSNGEILATERRGVGADSYDFLDSTGRDTFPASPLLFGSWSAAHRGMAQLIPGLQHALYGLYIPAGLITTTNGKLYAGIITPSALPLAFGQAVTHDPSTARVIAQWDLSAFPNQTLPSLRWEGHAVPYTPGDLLVFWVSNVRMICGTGTAYNGQYHIVVDISGRADQTALSVPLNTTVNSEVYRQFPYIAKVGAGPIRAGMGGPASYALLGPDGKLPASAVPVGKQPWSGRNVGIMGTSIETPDGGAGGATVGWAPMTLAALGVSSGTVGGVGSSLFCFIGNQGGGGDKLSFSATRDELTAIGGDPANSFQSKCFDKGFDLLSIGDCINDVTRNTDDPSLCAIGTPSDSSPNTIWGAFNRVVPAIQSNSKRCQLTIQGIPHGIVSRGGTITDAAIRITYNDALRAIAKRYHLPFLDFLDRSGVTLQNYQTRLADQGGAWIHPAQIQQDQMQRQATDFFNGL